VVDVARESTFRQGVAIADSALRKDVSKQQLETVLADCQNWPGISQAAKVVAFADGRAQAVSESLARVVFAEIGLPSPEPQFQVYHGQQLVAVSDCGFVEQRTVVEIDGKVKYVVDASDADPMRVVWDEKCREDKIREAGFEVVRLTWADLMRPEVVRAKVLAAFARAQRRPAG
jgi:very-short-patch-repair endonuclease